MPTTYQSGNVVRSRVLTFATHDPIQLVDITDAVAAVVRQARLQHGLVQLFSRHTTAAVRIQEDEPLLLEDLRQFLGRLARRTPTMATTTFARARSTCTRTSGPTDMPIACNSSWAAVRACRSWTAS